jgi:antitoxin (DNA-binding transcriptional repressor) of toxin-antitoxin stability system
MLAQANHQFSELLSLAERGEEILITKAQRTGRDLGALSANRP